MRRSQIIHRISLCVALGLCVGLLSGCSGGEKRIQSEDIVGIWKLDSKNLRSDDFSVDDFNQFALEIKSNGRFLVVGVPPSLFLNKESEKAKFWGDWELSYASGSNSIDFEIANLPGLYGTYFDWKDGRRVLRLTKTGTGTGTETGKGFIYIVKTD